MNVTIVWLMCGWVVGSLLLTLLWVAYRRLLATHSIDEFGAASSEPSSRRAESDLRL